MKSMLITLTFLLTVAVAAGVGATIGGDAVQAAKCQCDFGVVTYG